MSNVRRQQMPQWFIEYWYIIFGLGGSALVIVHRMRKQGAEGSFTRRLLYALLPVLNPSSSEHSKLTPRALWLVGIGLFIVFLAILLVPS
jgi:hypothetical protein